ncbi:Transmembrane domain-containing protein [Spironucleus salmonicida]|uniref:Transmembrane domain-containing protein n=1 Tax=Spironucleus salmonicida TaxID=348837 RepID=V6LHG4_9EUKA|nr:Transmembrane domain-containing protein [Spironucleus salmonicida]|eukprot:EST43987.1 Transmembrane domain-containing protein [Spironucleus salmonicida]
MVQAQRSDFIVILLCIVLVPLVFDTVNYVKITQIGSNISLYTEESFKNIKSPISIAMVDQNIGGQILNIPSVIVPSNQHGTIDAYALVGLQRELLYNQKLGLDQKNPYIQSDKLFTKGKVRQESLWKSYGQFFTSDTLASGQVKVISQELETQKAYGPQSFKKRTCGITDTLDVFLLSHTLQSIWVNKQLSQLIKDDTTVHEVVQLINYYVAMNQDYVFVSVYGMTAQLNVYLFNAALKIEDGSVYWLNSGVIKNESFSNDSSFVSTARISLEIDDEQQIDDLLILKEYLKTNPHRQHGIEYYIQLTEQYYVFRTQQLIHILNITTGQELTSFLLKPSVMLVTNRDNQLLLYAVFDGQLFVQNLIGNKMSEVQSILIHNITIVRHDVNKYKLRETHFANYYTSMFFAVTVATNEEVFMFINNKLIWQYRIKNVQILSIQRITNNQFIVIATNNETCYIFDLSKKKLISYFAFDSNSYNQFTNQQEFMTKSGIQVARFHPFIDEKSIIIQRGSKLDVLSVKYGQTWNYYVVLAITLLLIVISTGIFRSVHYDLKSD